MYSSAPRRYRYPVFRSVLLGFAKASASHFSLSLSLDPLPSFRTMLYFLDIASFIFFLFFCQFLTVIVVQISSRSLSCVSLSAIFISCLSALSSSWMYPPGSTPLKKKRKENKKKKRRRRQQVTERLAIFGYASSFNTSIYIDLSMRKIRHHHHHHHFVYYLYLYMSTYIYIINALILVHGPVVC